MAISESKEHEMSSSTVLYEALLGDLRAESEELIGLISALDIDAMNFTTPAKGWNVADCINHLTYFDGALMLAIQDREEFEVAKNKLMADGVDGATQQMRSLPHEVVVGSFVEARNSLLSLLTITSAKQRIPWYGPEMSAMSAASARLMETLAHGIDVYDALGRAKVFTDRISHICFLGFATYAFSFTVHGLAAPSEEIYLHLELPSGQIYAKGDPASPNVVQGSAIDYVLLITQRRTRDNLNLEAKGKWANDYLNIAQAFAGGPSIVDTDRAGLR